MSALLRQPKAIELDDSIKHFQSAFRKGHNGYEMTMQAAQDYASVKVHLEEKVANLKRQRDAAQKEVESLGLRVAIRELEKQAKSLEGELDALNGKRSLLEQKLASLDAPVAQLAPPQQRPAIKPAVAP